MTLHQAVAEQLKWERSCYECIYEAESIRMSRSEESGCRNASSGRKQVDDAAGGGMEIEEELLLQVRQAGSLVIGWRVSQLEL